MFGEGDGSLMYNPWFYGIPVIIEMGLAYMLFKLERMSLNTVLIAVVIMALLYLLGVLNFLPSFLSFLNLGS